MTRFAMTRFKGQVVVITGSATGIGAATARRFADEGAKVACLDVNDVANLATVAAITDAGGTANHYHCDVSLLGDQESAFGAVMESWNRVDVVVANAGIYLGGPLDEITMDRWNEILAVNLTGVLISNHLAGAIMKAQGSGCIVNISSMAAKTSWPYTAEYSATKTGVIGITRSAAMELGPFGVTVNAVCPGNTLTDMVRNVANEIGAAVGMSGTDWLEMRAQDTALKRLAQPEELAGVIAFLASDDARYLTGQAIEVDGGLVLG
jgi:NAD(P)-dependent dehydrogenase (short-subunit alcohol dehydrogenase family)